MLTRMLAATTAVAAAGGLIAWGAFSGYAEAGANAPASPPADPIGAYVAAKAEQACASDARYAAAAGANGASLHALSWSPFGRGEHGWEIYAPMIAQEIGSRCAPDSSAFAHALAAWQRAHDIKDDGQMGQSTFMAMKGGWQSARPFVAVRATGLCPNPPSDNQLVQLDADEGYLGKAIQLRRDTAGAYRAMVAAAHDEAPEIFDDPQAMRVFSGYRSPAYDDARCKRDGNCGGVTRAKCSSHRTGYTFDLVVGHAPGHPVDSTDDANRLAMTRSPAYRWMVQNAGRFGFVNYVFEPWHWEYRGNDDQGGSVVASAM